MKKAGILWTRTLTAMLLVVFTVSGAWAENVTPAEALQMAQDFMQNREASGSRPRKAQGMLQLTATRQVNDLYIFNVADNGGFVIVSNDDRTIPILGYSDSGCIDPDNMPENMRAWLQGYADEIAWLNEIGYTPTPSAANKAPKRAHESTTYPPLLQTTWYQNEPYNNLCPEYESGKKSATGCVATAMAQVMKYHKWPNGPTTEIPGYECTSLGKTLEALPATTFDWGNMLNSYADAYTTDQAAAVATLMRYCGQSVKMEYGKSSSAYTILVAAALVNCFNYKNTTQCVSRSCYSYESWVDLIYNEIKQGRPVIYAGQSDVSGHTFVCDGYVYDDGDLFHINWGWGGLSDGYFVLSVLNPAQQGIGGNPSNKSYSKGHHAVVGIQKPEDNGTVLDVPSIDLNLTVNSFTLSNTTIALGESVTITASITNNSTVSGSSTPADFDGDICIIADGAIDIMKMFQIPANATQNCTFTYTPTNTGEIPLNIVVPKNDGFYYCTLSDQTLTVVDQTPTDLAASYITSQSASIGWTNVGGATNWNLHYSQITSENFNGSFPGWTMGEWSEKGGWEWSASGGIGNTPCFRSPSYKEGEDLNPEVGLFTPEFTFGGSISFYAWGENEHFGVYISTDGIDYDPIAYNITATATPMLYSIDLSRYTSTGYIGIIHENSGGHTSESFLYVDDVAFTAPWTKVSNVTNPYTLGGLSTETDYAVQVQAVNNDGGDWSEVLPFTTTDNSFALLNDDNSAPEKNTGLIAAWNGIEADVTLSGRTLYKKDGKWNTLCLPFDMTAAQVTAQFSPGSEPYELKTLSETSFNNGTLTMTFADATTIEAGKPYIIRWPGQHVFDPTFTDPTFTGVTVKNTTAPAKTTYADFVGTYSPLTYTTEDKSILFLGSNNKLFYPDGAAETNIGAFRAYFELKGIIAGTPSGVKEFILNFDGDNATSLSEELRVKSEELNDESSSSATWFSIDGRRLDGKPTQRGIYIKNGEKVLIK